jgi:hypothetical protein|tara:strand:- start:132 stop:479 length:348 start_codon:yes stop_codon:yes gene_type:complete
MNFEEYKQDQLNPDVIAEGFISSLPSRIKKMWEQITLMLLDNVEVTNLLKKRFGNGTELTREELDFLKSVLKDNAKSIGVAALFIPPGGGVLLGLIHTLLKKQGINIMPKRLQGE